MDTKSEELMMENAVKIAQNSMNRDVYNELNLVRAPHERTQSEEQDIKPAPVAQHGLISRKNSQVSL